MHCLISLVKSAVENYINGGKVVKPPESLPKEFLEKKSGTFVTITENNGLRGCIGTYLPIRKNIAEEVIYNAIAAATEDYRFGPIQKEELSHLSYTVCILSPPELVEELDPVKWASPKIRRILFNRVNPKKYGVIVKASAKTGLLLPNLEDVDTVEQQISIACQKAGINPNKEKIIIYKFTVEKFS